VAERAVKSVVNISSLRAVQRDPSLSPFHGNPFFDRFFGPHGGPREERARSLGSGVIIAGEGIVLTNHHVVKDASQIRVRLADGRELDARLVGSDPKSDLAVLRLGGNPGPLQPLALGDSSKLRLGEVVLAIGNPFGVGQTVTMGIVSALGRANMGIVDYEDFIQTDAAINPGNSGGALVSMRGELVGIPTAILSRTGGYQGIGFAIPSNMAKPIADALLKHGRVTRGWLGVVIQDLTEQMAAALKAPVSRGVVVTDIVPDGPAAKAGLRRADVLTHLDGEALDGVVRLRSRVAAAGPTRVVRLRLIRDGKPLEVRATLAPLPEEAVATLDRSQGALAGLTLAPLTDDARRRLGLPARVSGVVVSAVAAGSAAQTAGLVEGDVIFEINRQTVTNPTQFGQLYRQAKDKVLLLIYRQGEPHYLLLQK
jgi:serine protease Do